MTETELVFTEILNCKLPFLYLDKKRILNKTETLLVSSVLKRRILGEPIQYIFRKTEFMGLELKVDRSVFIPRPETEILIETAIGIVTHQQSPATSLIILDLGTGSGNIAISLAKFLPQGEIHATDISQDALEIARTNAQLNTVGDRIKFMLSDLFNAHNLEPDTYGLIVSNPPYIPTTEIEILQPEIRYEPRIALDGGKDGLDFYRRIIGNSGRYLKEDGFLIMEMGFNQKGAVKNIFQEYRNFKIIEVIKDYNNIDRVIVAKNNSKWIN